MFPGTKKVLIILVFFGAFALFYYSPKSAWTTGWDSSTAADSEQQGTGTDDEQVLEEAIEDAYNSALFKPTLRIPKPRRGKNRAYVFVGNVEQPVNVEAVSSVMLGLYDINPALWLSPKEQFSYADNLIRNYKRFFPRLAEACLRKAGYQTTRVTETTYIDLKKALLDEQTGAIIWIGHGQADSFSDASGNQKIDDGILRDWATNYLKKKKLWKDPLMCRDKTEKMWMSEIAEKVHFDLLYFYCHCCKTMSGNCLTAKRLVADNGIYEGYNVSIQAFIAKFQPDISDRHRQEFPSIFEVPLMVPNFKKIHKRDAVAIAADRHIELELVPGKAAIDEYDSDFIYKQTPAPYTKLVGSPKISAYYYGPYDQSTSNEDSDDEPVIEEQSDEENGWFVWYVKNVSWQPVQVGKKEEFLSQEEIVFPGSGPVPKKMVRIPLVKNAPTREAAIKQACEEFSEKWPAPAIFANAQWMGKRRGTTHIIDGLKGCQ